MFRLVILSLIFIVSGCGGEIAYRPNKLEIEDAINIADELIMTQPRAWRPEGFGINEQYISLGFGSVTQANFWRNDKFVTKGTGQRICKNNVTIKNFTRFLFYSVLFCKFNVLLN
jgi:hypothetical protein